MTTLEHKKCDGVRFKTIQADGPSGSKVYALTRQIQREAT